MSSSHMLLSVRLNYKKTARISMAFWCVQLRALCATEFRDNGACVGFLECYATELADG